MPDRRLCYTGFMSVKELLETVKPLYDESGRRYGVFLSNAEWETLITFIDIGDFDASAQKMSEEQAADLRARLKTFAEEWDSPEMDIYDDYDAARSQL